MGITAETNLASLGENMEVKDVLAQFGMIHCVGCDLPDKTVAEVASESNLPTDVVLNAINARLA